MHFFTRSFTFALLVASLASPLASAQNAASSDASKQVEASEAVSADIAALQAQLAAFEFFSAQFEQTLSNEKGELLQQQKGSLRLQKPNLLNWQAEEPYAQQVVVDGLQVWLYDPDLEQVTVKPLSNDISQTPALILGGKIKQISQQYAIKQVAKGEFSLTPKQDNPLFKSMTLAFNGGVLDRLVIVDKLAQQTQVVLSQFDAKTPLDKSVFAFIAPEGTDVLRDQ